MYRPCSSKLAARSAAGSRAVWSPGCAGQSALPAHVLVHQETCRPRSKTALQVTAASPREAPLALDQEASALLQQLNGATKWAVTAAVTGTVLIRHDATTLWCVVGSVVAAAICKVLKAVINEQRPPNARAADPGMPSSHATSLSFLASYAAGALALQPQAMQSHTALAALVLLAAVFLAWLRVHTGYHTAPQTVAGFALGAGMAVSWLKLFDSFVAQWCRQEPRNFLAVAALAAAAAVAFLAKMIRKD